MTDSTVTSSEVFTSFLRPLLEFIYPRVCFVCGRPLHGGNERICSVCWGTLRPVTVDDPLYCEMLKLLSEAGTVAGLVTAYHFEKEGTLQSIIHQLKYQGMSKLGVELGERVGAVIRSSFGDLGVDGIIPIPLHPAKLRERGYNQSEHIARGIGRVVQVRVFPKLLRRWKYTRSQTRLNAAERKENVGNAFAVNKRFVHLIRGRSFLVADDVITTGATTEACARVLKQHGAASVFACAVGLADRMSGA